MSEWRKSSYSGTETDCVEVGTGFGIRDSKAPGSYLQLGAHTWGTFLEAVKSDHLGLNTPRNHRSGGGFRSNGL